MTYTDIGPIESETELAFEVALALFLIRFSCESFKIPLCTITDLC